MFDAAAVGENSKATGARKRRAPGQAPPTASPPSLLASYQEPQCGVRGLRSPRSSMTHATLMIRKCHPIWTTMTKFKKVRFVFFWQWGQCDQKWAGGPTPTNPNANFDPNNIGTRHTALRDGGAAVTFDGCYAYKVRVGDCPSSRAATIWSTVCLPAVSGKLPSSRAGLQHRVLHRPPQGLRDHPRVRHAARLQRPGPANRRLRRLLCHKRVERRLRRPRAHDAGGDGPARPRHVRWKPRRHGRDRARRRRLHAGGAARL